MTNTSDFATKTDNGVAGTEFAKLTATDKAASDYFGYSVVVNSDGTTVVVGAVYADPNGVTDAGAAYVYKYNGTEWVETKLTTGDKAVGDYFGISVAVNGDGTTIVVGASDADPNGVTNAGAVCVYKYNGSNWIETKLTAGDKTEYDYFGNSVSVNSDGTTVVVGAYGADPNGVIDAGAAYVYKYNGTEWIETKLTASDKAADDYFGITVAVNSDGTTVVVGAAYADPNGVIDAGAVYVYKYNGSNWIEAKLTASDKAASDYFGYSVSVNSDGTTVVVGAFYADPNGVIDAGAAYVYKYNGTEWIETKLVASDKAVKDYFGWSVAVNSDGTTVAVGAAYADPNGVTDAGAVYVYKYNGSSWQETKLTTNDKAVDDYFGWSVAVNGDGTTVVVGAYGADPNGVIDAGAVYIYK